MSHLGERCTSQASFQPGITSRVKTLREHCLACLGKWVHCLEDVGDMDVITWTDIVRHGRHQSTPEVISRVESCCPHLECRETDESYWRPLVDTAYPRRKLPVSLVEPHPDLCERVSQAVADLDQWTAAATAAAAPASNSPEARPLPENAMVVLETALLTVALLSETKCGLAVRAARKAPGANQNDVARLTALQDRWKAYHRRLQEHQEQPPSRSTSSSSSSTSKQAVASVAASGRQGGSNIDSKHGPLPHHLSPPQLEAAVAQCSSWKRLYYFLKDVDASRMEALVARGKAAYAAVESQKHRTQKLVKKSGAALGGTRKPFFLFAPRRGFTRQSQSPSTHSISYRHDLSEGSGSYRNSSNAFSSSSSSSGRNSSSSSSSSGSESYNSSSRKQTGRFTTQPAASKAASTLADSLHKSTHTSGKKRAAADIMAVRPHGDSQVRTTSKARRDVAPPTRVDCRPLNPSALVTKEKLDTYFRPQSEKAHARRQVQEAVWDEATSPPR